LGAYVKWRTLGVTDKTKAEVSLAGPVAGWCAAAFCAVMWLKSGSGIWAALARTGAWLNVLNLIPIWQLDGSGAIAVLNKVQRIAILVLCLVLWLSLHEGVFFLVAAGATYRLFTKDEPKEASMSTTLYYTVVLIALALLMHAMPHRTSGLAFSPLTPVA
jgi:Zn-dependent protease